MKKTPTTQALHTAALTGLLSLALLPPATAADFTGSLKGVTITDAQATNKPPVAAFTYSVNGNVVSFDASGSSDPDGTINEYKWDFGDGNFGSGVQPVHTYADLNNKNITLTLVDNSGGISLKQETFSTKCTNEVSLFSLQGSKTNNANVYSSARVVSGKFIGNGKKLTSITFKSGSDNGAANTIKVYVNSSQNFSGTTLATSTAKTPGANETLFTATFDNGPVLTNGTTYYWAINDDNITWSDRFSLTLVSDSTKNYYLTDTGLTGTFTQSVNSYGIWVEVKTCAD